MKTRKRANKIPLDLLCTTIASVDSYRKAAVILDSNHSYLHRQCIKHNIDTSHFKTNFIGEKRIGQTYYGLTILGPFTRKGPRDYSPCLCVCGNIVTKRVECVASGKIRYCSQKCTRIHNNTIPIGNKNPCFRGIGRIGSCVLNTIKHNAKRRKIDCELTLTYISELFDKQDGKCALTGLDLEFGQIRTSATTASLDRIDSSIGYIEGNVQWVHKLVNRMKMDLDESTFLELCHKITIHRNLCHQ